MPDFAQDTRIITPDNLQANFPQFLLNDISLLYSYSTDEFEIYGVPVIENMVYNVMYTVIGSRWFEPEFGSRVPIIVHDPLTLATANRLEMEIFSSIKRWIPVMSLIIRETVVIPKPDENLFIAYYSYVDSLTGLKRDFTLDLERVVQ